MLFRNSQPNKRHPLAVLALILLAVAPAQSTAPDPVTSYVQMTDELSADAARCNKIEMTSIGRSSTNTRDLWMVRCAAPGIDTTKTVRLMVLCRQHGDEPASTEAVLGLLSRIAEGKEDIITRELKKVTLYIVPMVNPDGADADTRLNGVGADLNRDWGKFSQSETRAVKQAVDAIRPHVIIDAHNWDAGDPHPFDCVEVALPTHDPLVESERSLQADAVQSLDQVGYNVRITGFGPKSDPRLAHRYFTDSGKIAMLVETHPGDSADTADFHRREQMYVALIRMLVRTLAHDSDFRRSRLDELEGYSNTKVAGAEKKLFAAPASTAPAPQPALPAAHPPVNHVTDSILWLMPICAVVFLGIAFKLSSRSPETRSIPGVSPRPGSARTQRDGLPRNRSSVDPVADPPRGAIKRWSRAMEPELFPFPATEWPKASRRDKHPCRYSPYGDEPWPPAEAYDRTPQTPSHDNPPPSRAEESCPPEISL